LLGEFIKGGVCLPGHRNAWNAPKCAAGGVHANYQRLIPNLQFTHCIIQKVHE